MDSPILIKVSVSNELTENKERSIKVDTSIDNRTIVVTNSGLIIGCKIDKNEK